MRRRHPTGLTTDRWDHRPKSPAPEGRHESEEEPDEEGQGLIDRVILGEAGPIRKTSRKDPPTKTCYDCDKTDIKNGMIKPMRREHAVMMIDKLGGEATVPE